MMHKQLLAQLAELYRGYNERSRHYTDEISLLKQEIIRLETEKANSQQLHIEEISMLQKKLADINAILCDEDKQTIVVDRLKQEISEIQFLLECQKEEFIKQKQQLQDQKLLLENQLAKQKDQNKLECERLMMLIQEKEMVGQELSHVDSM